MQTRGIGKKISVRFDWFNQQEQTAAVAYVSEGRIRKTGQKTDDKRETTFSWHTCGTDERHFITKRF